MIVAGCSDTYKLKQEKESWWKNVYGIDMSCLGRNFYVEPLVDVIPRHTIMTDLCVFKEFDLKLCTKEDIQFANEYKLQI